MLQILHAADLHLDAPFAALPPELAAQRRGEQRQLLRRMADLVRERGADLVFLSGDLFDHHQPYAETVQAVTAALGQMGCPVFIAPGNHDYYAPRTVYATADWPENVHIFTGAQPEAVPLPALGCTVWGAAFLSSERGDSPLAGFSAPAGGGVQLGVFHSEVDGGGRYAPISKEDIAASGLAYLALGHVHSCSGLCRAGETAWAYPGCTEGRGFDELGDKGCLWVCIEDGGGVRGEFVPLAHRRYRIVEADVSAHPSAAEALEAALPPDGQEDILRILFKGETGAEGLNLAPLEAIAAPHCWLATLRDQTHIRQALWARAEENTLTGLFLREMRDRLSAAQSPEEAQTLELAVRYGLAALEHREEPHA